MTTTTASAAQALEAVCDECAGDGRLAYDPQATMWVPRSATAAAARAGESTVLMLMSCA